MAFVLALASGGGERAASRPSATQGIPLPPAARYTSIAERYRDARDLRGFVERNLDRAADPAIAFYVSQALEECSVVRPLPADENRPGAWSRKAAAESLADACRGFDGNVIAPDLIVSLLRRAAESGEPHAMARMLLFRDVATPKDDVIAVLPSLLATGDPAVVRDVGAFLSRGESAWRYGSEDVPAGAAAIAWELAACDLGYACGPASRLVLMQCAFMGNCELGRYEDTLASREDPQAMAQALRLRPGIVRALRNRDWEWLGLG